MAREDEGYVPTKIYMRPHVAKAFRNHRHEAGCIRDCDRYLDAAFTLQFRRHDIPERAVPLPRRETRILLRPETIRKADRLAAFWGLSRSIAIEIAVNDLAQRGGWNASRLLEAELRALHNGGQ